MKKMENRGSFPTKHVMNIFSTLLAFVMQKQTCYHYLRLGPAIGVFDREEVFSSEDNLARNEKFIRKLMKQECSGGGDYGVSIVDKTNNDRYVIWKDEAALFNMRLPMNEWFAPSRGTAIFMREDGKVLPGNSEIDHILQDYREERRKDLGQPTFVMYSVGRPDDALVSPNTLRMDVEEVRMRTIMHFIQDETEEEIKSEIKPENKEETKSEIKPENKEEIKEEEIKEEIKETTEEISEEPNKEKCN